MASALIGSLRVALGLDTAQFEAGANKARSSARGLSKDIESSFKSAKVAVEGLVAAFAVGALTNQIQQSLKYAAAIGETASTLGVTTKQLQEFRFAAQQVGVSQEALEGGLQRLTVSMGKAEVGSQAQIKAFKAIGISVDQLKGKNTGEIFSMIADGLKNVTDRSQRAAVEVALFGRTGAQLDSLLSGGTARLNALAQAAQQLGVVLSDEQIQNAEQTAHKLEALKTVLEANIASTVTSNANSILSLAQALSTLTNQILHFFSSNPQLALSIIGGLAGSRFGVAGAAVGAGIGAFAGEKVAENQADQNMNYIFRLQQLQKAEQEVARLKGQQQEGDTSILGGLITFHHGSTGASGGLKSAQTELAKQRKLFAQAGTAALQPDQGPPPPGINLPQFLAPKGPKGRKPPADRSDELLAQMDKEILQAEQNILQAKLGLAGSNEEHLQIAIQLVQLEKTAKDKAIDEEVARAEREHAEHKITDAALQQVEAKARILKAENAAEAAAKLQAIVEEQLARAEQANFEIAVQKLKFQQDALHVADQLATTAEDHRRIQLQILASEIAQQRLELEHEKDLVIRNHGTKEEIDAIQQKIDNLPVQQAQGAALINANNRSPLDQWAHDVPKTAAEINQALQSIEVEGLDGLTDAIEKVITGTESMKDAFHELAASILADLLKMTIKMILFQALEAAMGGGGGGIPSPDLGGEMSVTGLNGGVAPSLPGGFASGGFVSGDGSSTSDSIPAMLSNGEYVMSAAAVRKFGVEMLDAINTGRLPHKRGGGIFGALKFVSPVAFLQSQGMLRYLSIPGTIADAFGVKGFASGGIVQGLPIPMIAMGNAAAPYRNTPMQPPVQVINNNDFRGADPSAVAAIKMHLDDLEASLPGKIVTTVRDAQQRFVLGGRR